MKPKRRHIEPPPERSSGLPESIRARILHEDTAVIILDKPAGLAVHRGPRGGASLEDWLPALQQGKRHLPQPAHRLDTDTAGCLALGRTKPSVAALNKLFADGLARKTYWAVLVAPPPTERGVCEVPLLKISTKAKGWRIVVDPAGQTARTEWRVLGREGALTAVELTPRTGRTHQLRAHMAHLGCPILGDARYGGGDGAMHLLARALALPGIVAEAPIPAHMRKALALCGVS